MRCTVNRFRVKVAMVLTLLMALANAHQASTPAQVADPVFSCRIWFLWYL